MIIKQTPVERRLWASGATGTDKSEGKLVKASADGKTMSLLTSASDIPDGVVSNPDGRDGADGNGGDLVRMSHPGIVQVRLNDTPGAIEDGTDLVCNVAVHCGKIIKQCGKTSLNATPLHLYCNIGASPLQAASRPPQSTVSSSSLATPSRSILSLASASRCITLARSLAGWVSSRGLPVVTTANREA